MTVFGQTIVVSYATPEGLYIISGVINRDGSISWGDAKRLGSPEKDGK